MPDTGTPSTVNRQAGPNRMTNASRLGSSRRWGAPGPRHWHRESAETFDERAELSHVAALVHSVAVLGVIGDDGVAAIPDGFWLRIEPEDVRGATRHLLDHGCSGRAVARPGVAEYEHCGAALELQSMLLPECVQRVAVVRSAVQPDAERLSVDLPGHVHDVVRAL